MSVIIRLENLPWEARSIDIRRFFQGLQIPDGGVHIVGGDRGDAFIAFHSDDDARQAMQKNGGLISNQPVKLFLSSKIEMQHVIAAARGKPSAPSNPVTNSNQSTQQTNIPQQKRTDPLSQQYTHDIDENQHQQQTQTSTTQSNVTNDPMSSFLDVVTKMQQQQQQQQQKPNTAATTLPTTTSVLPTPPTATPAATGLAPANLVLQLLQSNLSNLPPNVLAQVQGQLAGQGLASQPNQVLQQLAALQAATQQQASPMQTNSSHSPIYNPTQSASTNPSVGHHNLQQSSIHDTNQTTNNNAFPQGAPPPLNLFPPGTIPPNALTALLNAQQQQQQQQLPFQSVANQLPANFPLPPWMQPAAGQTPSFNLQQQPQQQQQQQRSLLNHPLIQDDQQMRLRQHDFNSNITNQFQQSYSTGNSRLPQQQQQQQQQLRSKLREPYLRVKNLSRKYSYRDVKLLFADYKLRLEDIKMINDQNGERTGESVVQFRSIEDADEALLQFNNVYYGGANVQIVPASEYEFASALDSFIPGSVKKRQPEGGYCVKVIGLPKNWYKRDIRRLFTASEIVSERGIYLDNENDNNNQGGTAYIEFVSEVDLEKALFYHDEHYGSSRLEIQPITKKEMESEIASLRSKDNRRRDYYDGDSRPRPRSRSRSRSRSPKERDTRRYPPRDETNGDNTGGGGGSYLRRPRHNEELPPTITCLRLRNIPYATRDHDVKTFFAGIEVAQDGILFKYDKTGRPAGECYVRFGSSNDCRKAYEKNRSQFGGRILELRPLSLWEFQAATSQEPDETGATFSANGGLGRREQFGNNGGGGGGGGGGQMYHGGPMSEKRKFPYERMDDNGNNDDKSPSDPQRFDRRKGDSSSPRGGGGDGDKSPSNMIGGGSMDDQNGRKMMRGGGNNNNSSFIQKQLTQLPPGYDQYRGQVLLMSNVHFRATREEILHFLHSFHPIEDTLKIHRDSSGRPTGHAVVALTNADDVPQALKELHNSLFLLRKISVCVV
ncbi:unnamed protein product [Adineta steineri]|uniref:RRM domain-containing protein n=1 Tax=Adineta steineri TaxID=433720 RepID=A0A818JQF5_9BILA|nr:unnamed protein product [Adineta steineri]CAF3542946.1 unnamed protein product [Adineta steineri]